MRPQGFLTAVKQEVTRQNAAAKWSLDEVDYKTDVLKEIVTAEDGSIEGKNFKTPAEGVLIHGLFLEVPNGANLACISRNLKVKILKICSSNSQLCIYLLSQQGLQKTEDKTHNRRVKKPEPNLRRAAITAQSISTRPELTSTSSSVSSSSLSQQPHPP
jgi:hypothetical protein